MTPHSVSMQRRVILAALRCRTIYSQPKNAKMETDGLPLQFGALVCKNVRAEVALDLQSMRVSLIARS
jgi:hypothetical protein